MQKAAMRLKRHCTRLAIGLACSAPLLSIGAAWLAAREITSPSRRPLQDYHHVILNAPASHGITIAPFTLSDGTHSLLCRPDPAGTLDQRGTLLRSQLQQRSLTLPPIGIENNATLVLLHGRRGRKEDLLPIAVRFCAIGFRCLLIDLPAHGENSTPVATFGPNEAPLPLKALTEAAAKFNFPARPAGLWGMSMGGSVAIHATASTPSHWDALTIVASFDALAPVIARQSSQLLGDTLAPPSSPPSSPVSTPTAASPSIKSNPPHSPRTSKSPPSSPMATTTLSSPSLPPATSSTPSARQTNPSSTSAAAPTATSSSLSTPSTPI